MLSNTFSRFKQIITNSKNKARNRAQKFKKNFDEAKNKPKSKRKAFFLGFTTVLGIFAVTLVAPVLPAVAKDLPKQGANEAANQAANQICPTPAPPPSLIIPSAQIVDGLTGAAGAVCALAIKSGSYLIGGLCGIIVVIGILKAQGK